MRNMTKFSDEYLSKNIPLASCPSCKSVTGEIISANQLQTTIKVTRKCKRCGTYFSVKYPLDTQIAKSNDVKTPQRTVDDKTRVIQPIKRTSYQNKAKEEYDKNRLNTINQQRKLNDTLYPLPVVQIDDSLFELDELKDTTSVTNTVNTVPTIPKSEELTTPWGKPIKNEKKWKRKCANDIVSDRLWWLGILAIVLVSVIVTYFGTELVYDYNESSIANIIYTLLIGVPAVCFILFLSIMYDLRGTAFGKY